MESAGRAPLRDETTGQFRITDFPLHYVVFVQKYAQAAFSRVLKPHGLTNQSWRVLAALSGGKALTIGQIADLTVFDAANLGRTLDAMEQDGLVERQPDPHDRRAVNTVITSDGRALFEAAYVDICRIYEHLLEGFGPGELQALMSGLRRMKQNCQVLIGALG